MMNVLITELTPLRQSSIYNTKSSSHFLEKGVRLLTGSSRRKDYHKPSYAKAQQCLKAQSPTH